MKRIMDNDGSALIETDTSGDMNSLQWSREKEGDDDQKAWVRALLKLSEREGEVKLAVIKGRCLRSNPKKRAIKPSEMIRFSFDWESTEYISGDINWLYQIPHEAQLLFGRGFQAGMDRRKQKKLASINQNEIQEEIHKEGTEGARD